MGLPRDLASSPISHYSSKRNENDKTYGPAVRGGDLMRVLGTLVIIVLVGGGIFLAASKSDVLHLITYEVLAEGATANTQATISYAWRDGHRLIKPANTMTNRKVPLQNGWIKTVTLYHKSHASVSAKVLTGESVRLVCKIYSGEAGDPQRIPLTAANSELITNPQVSCSL